MVTDPLPRIGAHPPLRTPVSISPHAPRLPPSPPDVGAVLSAPTHPRQRLISEEAVHPSASPHQGSAMRAMAGFTDVAWSPTTPILARADSILPAGWGGALGAAERAGRRNPRFGAARRHRDALAGRWGARRVDRGRKAVPARSAELRSVRDQPLRASPGRPPPPTAPPPPPISLSAMGGRRPPTFVSPAMPPAGWLGGVRIRQRTDLRR